MSLSYYKKIDDFLGDRNSRYFGDGYLKTNQSIENFQLLTGADHTRFVCNGVVMLPEVWSKKGKSNQTPHLSTIDVLELSIECLRQLLLARTLQNRPISAGHIKQISIIAGNAPVETSLDNIEISGKVLEDSDGNHVLEVSIANMQLEIVYVPTVSASLPVLSLKKQPIEVSCVMVHADNDESTASAVVKPLSIYTDETWSISSCFAASLQLGQTLLYNLDNVDRAKSNTLWMKRTTITFSNELSRLTLLSQPISTKLENVRKYNKTDGDWRRADIVSVFCNAKIVCSVTHRLPPDIQPKKTYQ